MDNNKKSKLDITYDAIKKYESFIDQNALSDDEKVDIKLCPKDSNKKSTAKYQSSEGNIKVTHNPAMKQATIQAEFVTGKFKAVIEENNISVKGQAPFHHPHWGSFNNIFTDE